MSASRSLPTLYALKPAFQRCLRPCVNALARAGVRPNTITLAALAGSAVVGTAIGTFVTDAPAVLLLLPGWMLLRMALNAMDGMLAREHDRTTRLGALLNELTDPVADALLILPLALVPGVHPASVVALVLTAMCTELVGVAALSIGAERRYDGPMGKSDRAAVVGGFALLVGSGVPASAWGTPFFIVVTVLAAMTVVRRMQMALRTEASA